VLERARVYKKVETGVRARLGLATLTGGDDDNDGGNIPCALWLRIGCAQHRTEGQRLDQYAPQPVFESSLRSESELVPLADEWESLSSLSYEFDTKSL
jgi:hypothetical protein